MLRRAPAGTPRARRGTRPGARAIVRQYPVGASITCYVNPAAPAEAVVLREQEQDLRLQLVGPLLVLVSIVFFFMVKRAAARRRSEEQA